MAERVAVLGAAGYAGAVASALLHRHPHFELAHVTARSDAGVPLADVHPRTRVPLVLEEYDPDRHADVDAAVVAYPHGAAAPVVAELRERGVRVVDLSADFRLHDRAVYEDWYGEHGAPALLGSAVYGLPELHRDEIAGADLVANPGCYPTAAILALAPLARAGLLGDVVIDAKSGVSGAGREPTPRQALRQRRRDGHAVQGRPPPPHAGDRAGARRRRPARDVHAASRPARPRRAGRPVTSLPRARSDAGVRAVRRRYGGEPWVEVVEGPPGMQEVRETNFCRISVHDDERTGRIIVFATIDNLWKGTSSQAVQNLNLMFGRDESEGL